VRATSVAATARKLYPLPAALQPRFLHELMNITRIWLEAALRLDERDLS